MDKLDKFVLDNKRAVGVFAAGAAAVVGAKILAKSLSFLVKTLTPSYDLIERYGQGSYAVVSAATDGIGKGFALQLAKRGFNLVMLIRNKEKGEALAEEIRSTINPNIQIRIVEIDFSQILTPGVVQSAIDTFDGVDVSLLVNNVGLHLRTLSLEQQTEEELLKMIAMNIASQTLLTNKLISRMRQRPGNKSGVISLSSITKIEPLCGFTVYGACKSYNDYFSRSLSEEYKGEVDFLSIRPGWVATPMTDGFKKKQLEILPEECADSALKALGRVTHTPGHWKHKIATLFIADSAVKENNKLFKIIKHQREASQKK